MEINEKQGSSGVAKAGLTTGIIGTSLGALAGLGELTVRGNQLHIERIDLQAGELELQGQVDALTYADQPAVRGGFFARIFR